MDLEVLIDEKEAGELAMKVALSSSLNEEITELSGIETKKFATEDGETQSNDETEDGGSDGASRSSSEHDTSFDSDEEDNFDVCFVTSDNRVGS